MNLPDGYFLQKKKYQLTYTIGQGGFGITYLGVWNTEVKGGLGAMKTKVPVCIKEYFFKDYCYRDKDSYAVKVHSETGEKLFDKFKEKLIKEANILSEVQHPYIVNVLEVFEENNTAYIVMEYIEGCSLKYMLDKEGVLTENKVLKYVHQIGNALDFAHEKSVVHLDIKPSNILIDKEDNARLIDFGVSKRYDIDKQETSTTTLTLSKGFASIEQYDNEGTQNFSPCPDIYSLGATMYNLLTGIIPVESILRATKQMLSPSSYNSNVTQKTENVILKAMEVKPEDRYQVIKEMLASLDIPPYELTENTLVESEKQRGNDATEVLNADFSKADGDEDRTIAVSSSVNEDFRESSSHSWKKTKRRIFLPVAILFFAFIGYAIYSYFENITTSRSASGIDMPGAGHSIVDTGRLDNKLSVISGIPDQQVGQKPEDDDREQGGMEQQQSDPENASSKSETGTEQGRTPDVQSGVTPPQPSDLSAENLQAAAEEEARIEKEYQELVASAKNKMKSKDYTGAYDDLMSAVNKKTTEEALNLMQQCREEKEKNIVKERLAKYLIFDKIDFGDLKIVRKLDSGLFGAINAKGEEVIPCKYLDTDTSNDDRLFLREDNLYDVYDNKGRNMGTKSADL
ncbi:MAG: serine/threonine protein kinase [Tannerella sp.]|jgi:serine/threonine-protein kinase|nr:serine/threonine protein kinase [Tannerella sp.]